MPKLRYITGPLGVLNSDEEREFQESQYGSMGRAIKAGLVILSLIIWIGYLVLRTKNLTIDFLPIFLIAQIFILGIFLTLRVQGNQRIVVNYIGNILPSIAMYCFFKYFVFHLPNRELALQSQIFSALIILSIYTLEQLSPLMAFISAVLASCVAFVMRKYHVYFDQLSEIQNFFQLFVLNLIGAFVAYETAVLKRREFKLQKQLAKEKSFADDLLLKVFPKGIVEEMQSKGANIASAHSNVSILFADLVGFTKLASETPPARLIRMLHDLFTRFDVLADAYGVEKIKTMGDAYMAVAGCPNPTPDHAKRMAYFALAIRSSLEDFNRTYDTAINLRIGIHTGSVVAGVICDKRISFDIWGDAVNITSRLESMASPGEIVLSRAVVPFLENSFSWTDLRAVELKGRGVVEVVTLGEAVYENPYSTSIMKDAEKKSVSQLSEYSFLSNFDSSSPRP